jgi:hypothetical protein
VGTIEVDLIKMVKKTDTVTMGKNQIQSLGIVGYG